ncbi:hypothetical protein TSUD_91110 [Trifolium subterraneum]|uniref:Reverse transcriptase domain-containing protein n=1 Tax=Trifolium subterraneum TaxID=3900 RepID=A0A2Z6P505_TRISU|nr:hypothetical protein TSUD_91110 [Trifolium subterraneum]
MKIISWNIRGLGGVEKRKEVRKLVGDLNPLIVCIQETKLQNCEDFLCVSLSGSSPYAFSFQPSVGAAGGLLTLWDPAEIEMWSTASSEDVLWCHGRFSKTDEEFFLANVYAPCEAGAKQVLLDSLSGRLQALEGKRVFVCGDFNAVRRVDERQSRRARPSSVDHIPFNRFIDENNLVDLPLSGRKFTWFKGDGLPMSRLDRFLLSEDWCLSWPNCNQIAQLRGLSDHCPLVLTTKEENWGPRPSRMLKCWKNNPDYFQFVRDKWNSLQVDGWGDFVLKEKFKMIKSALKEWHQSHAQNLPSRIESLKLQLSALDNKGGDAVLSAVELEEMHEISSDIHSLSRMNASICWQQSRSRWLTEGDANTKYFHSIFASRRRGNTISSIQVDGVTTEGVLPIRQAVLSYFTGHFKACNQERPGEVKATVWDCESYKSPGPHGINFGFIKDFWSELHADIMRFITEFHRNGKLSRDINANFIALITKIDSPQRLNDFRLISLFGSLYKILAKVLANRLRLVIGSVISESQTAFVRDRQILDGILIANEVVDEAYEVMGRMSFPTLWRKWIKECICTATASALVNGSPTAEFPLERGLRQGDPLSPFLFLIAAEGLHVLMKATVENNLFTGYSVGIQGPITVSHLQFADDTLLLGGKSWANVRSLQAVLVLFELMSGLKDNFTKSMLVGVNVSDTWLIEATAALKCKVGNVPFLYLCIPIGGDPRRLSFWEPEYGGLGVRRLLEFNIALLGKWCWRMLVDREGLWFRVLAARYGMERDRLREGGRRGSLWWREIVNIREGRGDRGGGWFGECVSKKVGDGSGTLFWTDPWLEGTPLCERFGRLFDLDVHKLSRVDEMFALGWEVGGEAWEWRRQLWAWEEELVRECQDLLHAFSLQAHFSDSWQWQPDPANGDSVRSAYQILTSQESAPLPATSDLILHKQVPLKISILAWRLLRDRLPTKANLAARDIITPAAHLCVSGCGDIESAQHLFLSCSTFGSLWSSVRSWIGFSAGNPHSLPDHFLQFTFSLGGTMVRQSFLQLI